MYERYDDGLGDYGDEVGIADYHCEDCGETVDVDDPRAYDIDDDEVQP